LLTSRRNTTSMNSILYRFKTQALGQFRSDTEILYPDLGPVDRMLQLSTYGMQNLARDNISLVVRKATATIPTSFASRVLYAYINHPNSSSSIMMPQPVLNVTCVSSYYESKRQSDNIFYVTKNGSSLGLLGNLSSLVHQVKSLGVLDSPVHLPEDNPQYFEPIWLASPEPDSRSLVAVLFAGSSKDRTELQSLS
jgi:hypothetical protein